MVRCSSGVAVGFDLARAARSAAGQALAGLDGHRPHLACVFAHGSEPEQVAMALAEASAALQATAVIGCSASHGVIGGGHAIDDVSAVSVFVAEIPGMRLRAFHLEVIRTPESIAVVGMPSLDGEDKLALILADAYSFPVEGFVEGSDQALAGLPIAGGLAVGAKGAGSTRLLLDGRVVERGAVGVVLGGSVGLGAMVSQGCRPIGQPMTVTRGEGNVLLELAGRPALQRLEDLLSTLGPRDRSIAENDLQVGVVRDEYADELEQGDFLIRNIVRLDTERQALLVEDDVDVGQTIQFQLRDAGAASSDLTQGLERWSRRNDLDTIQGALLFTCVGRRTHFFDSGDHDAIAVRDGLGGSPPVVGYFTPGEIGPVGERNYLHDFSAAVVAFGDQSARGDKLTQ